MVLIYFRCLPNIGPAQIYALERNITDIEILKKAYNIELQIAVKAALVAYI